MTARTTLIILLLSVVMSPIVAVSQDCSEASQNVLCAENPPTADTLTSTPFSYGCFDAQLTYYFTFHTSTNPGSQVFVNIDPTDCDDFNGTNNISVIVFEIAPGSDPCDPSNYINASNCYEDNTAFTAAFSNLTPDADHVVIVGSDHDDINYGPCMFEASVNGPGVDIDASVDPILITLGESADLSVIGGTGEYFWSPAETLSNYTGPQTESTPEGTTTYTVQSTIGSCIVTDNVTVTVGPPVVIYNAFTPNGDGINDGWTIQDIQKFEDALVNVYDRWGQNVFRSLGYGKPWDGTNKGKFLPSAAYYYVIELNSPDVNIPPITGIVSIIH